MIQGRTGMATIFVTIERARGGYIIREVKPYRNPAPEETDPDAERRVEVVSDDHWNVSDRVGKVIVDMLRTDEETREAAEREGRVRENLRKGEVTGETT